VLVRSLYLTESLIVALRGALIQPRPTAETHLNGAVDTVLPSVDAQLSRGGLHCHNATEAKECPVLRGAVACGAVLVPLRLPRIDRRSHQF
jgi:hypothetical protein